MGCCGSKGDANAHPDIVPIAANGSPALSKEWLQAAMKRGGSLPAGASVTRLETDAMVVMSLEGNEREDGGGISGPKIVKLRVGYSGEGVAVLPATVVVKWGSLAHFVPFELPIRVYLWYVGLSFEKMLRCEAAVYSNAKTLEDAGLRIPKILYNGVTFPKGSDGQPDDANSCLFVCCGRRTAVRAVQVMEDCSVDYEPCPVAHHTPIDRSTAILATMAKVHAWGWGKTTAPFEGAWDLSPHVAAGIGRTKRQYGAKANFSDGKAVAEYITLWKDVATMNLDTSRSSTYKDHPEFLTMLTQIAEGATIWEPKAAALSPLEGAKPVGSTILHGDMHQWNHLFRKGEGADPNDLILIDWQFTGCGHAAWEVQYMFGASQDFISVDTDMGLLRGYYDQLMVQLQKQGKMEQLVGGKTAAQYTFDQFYEEWLIVHLDGMAQSIITMSKFIKPPAFEKLLEDEKDRELMLISMCVRNRVLARLYGHLIANPDQNMKNKLLGGDSETAEETPLINQL